MRLRFLMLAVGAVLLIGSCTSRFEDINTNPNYPLPGSNDAKYLLAYALNRSVLPSNAYQNVQTMNADEFAQFYANSLQSGTALAASNYKINDQYISTFWDNYYLYFASLNTIIRDFSSRPEYTNIVQMARIWKCWMYQRLTDAYGDVPYFNAANGTGENPAYDDQKDIYYDMFIVLADAVTKFDNAQTSPGVQDLVYGGDNAKWIKFANSLRLRMAIRISSVDAAKAKTEAEAAIAGGVINLETESAYIKFGGVSSTEINPMAHNKGGMRMSTTVYNMLNNIGGQAWPTGATAPAAPSDGNPAVVDPRGPYMFDLAEDSNGTYQGLWTGTYPGLSLANVSLPQNLAEANSYVGAKFRVSDKKFAILKYSETCLLLSEAALNGWAAGGTAQYWYEEGVTASFAEYEVAATATAYLASTVANDFGTSAAYTHTAGTNNTALDKIHTQKWIVLFPENSWEAWAEFRRTNKPTMLVPEYVDPSYFQAPSSNVSTNPKAFIQRLPYPASEGNTNPISYSAAISKLGGSDYQIQKAVWWDPNK